MHRYVTIAALGSLVCLTAAAQKPTPDEQKRTIDAARDLAIHYTSKLPDFICNEQVERTDAVLPNNNIKVDRLNIELSYFGQKEKQKLLTINGNKTDHKLESLSGLITGGEFGSLQLALFDTSSATEFQWKEASTVLKRKVAVYSYKVARAKSHYIVGYRDENGKMVGAPAGYHGEIYLDAETNRVLRLVANADDFPKESGIVISSVDVDYDFVEVGGKSYLLPAHSTSRMERVVRRTTNVVSFTGYKKFEADSTIDFGSGKQ
jgi:hypothetical protein